MTNPNLQRLRSAIGVLTAVSIFAAALALMAGCLGLYRADTFTPEAVSAVFAGIRVPVYLCLGLVAAGFIADLLLPCPAAPKRTPNVLMQLTAQRNRTDAAGCDDDTAAALQAVHLQRKRRHWACGLVTATAAVLFLIYALDGRHFHTSQINESMIAAMPLFLACLVVSFAAAVYSSLGDIADAKRELALLKTLPKVPVSSGQTPKKLPAVTIVLLCAAAAALLFGLFTGGTADVLTKAVNICTECVGLG